MIAPKYQFTPGDYVECLDATDGAHFLDIGHVYRVMSTQVDGDGRLRLNLYGMARAWECDRFRPAGVADTSP